MISDCGRIPNFQSSASELDFAMAQFGLAPAWSIQGYSRQFPPARRVVRLSIVARSTAKRQRLKEVACWGGRAGPVVPPAKVERLTT